MTRMRTLPLAILIVALLAGCTPGQGGDSAGAPTPSATIGTPAPTATPTPTVAPPPPPPPTSTLTPVDPATLMSNIGGPGVEFDSPSGNIACSIYPDANYDYWGCSIADYHYEDPAPTGDLIACSENVHYGGGFIVYGEGPVEVLCRGGAMFGGEVGTPGVGVLAYGTSVTYNDVLCESYEDHTGCRSLVTGHGFTLARGEYSVF